MAGALYTPLEITQKTEEIWVIKCSNSFRRTIVLWILWWMFVAMWAAFSLNSITWLESLPFGLMKLVGWITFCLWLILVILGGGELFTWNVLLVIALLQKKVTLKQFLKNLVAVWIWNLIWSLIIVTLLYLWKWYMYDNWWTAELILAFASKKSHLWFMQALSMWILCNIYVCFAIWICYSWTTATDKIMATIFPITAFAAIGFEHIVANMFYLPFGLILKKFNPEIYINNPELLHKVEYINFENIFIHNVIPVTLWNLIGWALFVWVVYWLLFCKYKKK